MEFIFIRNKGCVTQTVDLLTNQPSCLIGQSSTHITSISYINTYIKYPYTNNTTSIIFQSSTFLNTIQVTISNCLIEFFILSNIFVLILILQFISKWVCFSFKGISTIWQHNWNNWSMLLKSYNLYQKRLKLISQYF